MLKHSFTNQNPQSLTCDAISDPEPIAITIRSLFRPGMAAAIGAMMLDADSGVDTCDVEDSAEPAACTNHEQHTSIGR